MWIASAYTAKTKEDITQVLHDEISSLGTTSETTPASLSSTNNISQKSGDVNSGNPHKNKESREILVKDVPNIYGGKSIDEVTAEMTEQHRARFKTKSKAEFDAMPDTDKLKAAGVTGISGSVGLYGQTEQAIEQKQAEKTTAKAKKGKRTLQTGTLPLYFRPAEII